jgi:hypothetical protein
MLTASQAARAAHLLTTPPVTDEVVGRARWVARDVAAGLFLRPTPDEIGVGSSVVAVALAGAYARRLSDTLDALLRARADLPAAGVLGDAFHLCRHLRVGVSAPDPTAAGDGPSSLRAHLRAELHAARAEP